MCFDILSMYENTNTKLVISLTSILLMNCISEIKTQAVVSGTCRKPYIDILISPMFENGFKNQIELIWSIDNFIPGSTLSLIERSSQMEIFRVKLNSSSGYVNTKIIYQRDNNAYGFSKQLLEYYIEYRATESGPPLQTENMETNPSWMEDNSESLSSMRVRDLFIPGTHDAGASTEEDEYGESRVQKYVMTQDETILNQLIFGIRSLDIRVGYYSTKNETSKLYLNHGIQRICLLSTAIEDIKLFMQNTREIVILDIHQFPIGFNINTPDVNPHDILIQYLVQELQTYLAPANLTWTAKLKDFWKINKTLILAYNHKESLEAHSDILWLPINQRWANAQDIDTLKEYLEREFNQPPVGPWSAMAELTATSMDILTDDMKGLRNMAYSVNKEVTFWFLGEWGKKANVVACDFFRESGIVKSAITWNLRKAHNTSCDENL